MSDLYLFEAGSTKTDLICEVNGERKENALPGFNPNRDSSEFVKALKDVGEIAPNSTIFFYGSGLGNDENKKIVRDLFSFLEAGQVKIHDDILGAARAAFNTFPGIICIMGTGGLAAYYNGRDIVKRRGGYGHLIDDLGGGLELGQRILAAWLNGDLSETCEKELKAFINLDKKLFVREVYKRKNLKLIASVSRVMAPIVDDSLQKVVDQYFEDFFSRNVLPLTAEFDVKNFSIIGSIGTGYYKSIRKHSDSQGLQLDQCIQSPARRLFDFHIQKR